jgi:aldose 1-epimerase
MSISHSMYLGEPAVIAESDHLAITVVPGLGGKLVSIAHRATGLELLRQPQSRTEHDERPVLFGDPILFPPNRIADGRFTFAGRDYQFDVNEPDKHNHIHGFVYTRPWRLERVEDGETILVEVAFDSAYHPEVERQLPHRFSLRVQYRLTGSILQKRALVTNHSDAALPLGFGYHTTFRFPFAPDGDLSNCRFSIPAAQRWLLDSRNLPTGQLVDVDPHDVEEGLHIDGIPLDDVFRADESLQNEAVLTDRQAGLEVRYRCDVLFKHWVVYNGDGRQGFICPEPYTWVTNAPNLSLPAELTGMRALGPGESQELNAWIDVRYF